MLYGNDFQPIEKLHETLKALFDLYKDKIPSYSVVCDDLLVTSTQIQGVVLKVLLIGLFLTLLLSCQTYILILSQRIRCHG